MSEAAAGLDVVGLSGGYPGREVVRDLTLRGIAPGDVVALVGPNAAGKSTILRMLAGIVPARGAIQLGDVDLARASLRDRARLVAFMPQTWPSMVGLSVFEGTIASLRATPAGTGFLSDREIEERAVDTLDRLGIVDLALRPYDRLSGGQRQLASLAQAVVRQPRLLLLDEPTSALDLGHQLRVMSLVRDVARESRLVAVVVLHDLTLACRWADRIAVLHEGRLVASGSPTSSITPALLRRVYEVDAVVHRGSDGHPMIEVRTSKADIGPTPGRGR